MPDLTRCVEEYVGGLSARGRATAATANKRNCILYTPDAKEQEQNSKLFTLYPHSSFSYEVC